MNHAIRLIGTSERVSWREMWRARKLTSDRTRRRLAAGLERAIADAEAPRPRLSAAVPVRRCSVIAARGELLELIERLRAPRPVYAQGVAMATELLQDGGSPLYQANGDLHAAVEAALEALDGRIE